MAHLVWTEPALEDLEAIAEYIALDKPAAAERLVQRVFARVDHLQAFPKSGSQPRELKRTPYRHVIIPPVRIFYRIDGDTIYIVHVMRSEKLFNLDVLTDREA